MTIDFNINVVDKSTYVITLFWNSTPLQIINEDKRGIPILSVDFGIFYTKTDISQPNLSISNLLNNILQIDENNKLVDCIDKEKWYTYKAKFNREPEEGELKTLKWASEYDDGKKNTRMEALVYLDSVSVGCGSRVRFRPA